MEGKYCQNPVTVKYFWHGNEEVQYSCSHHGLWAAHVSKSLGLALPLLKLTEAEKKDKSIHCNQIAD